MKKFIIFIVIVNLSNFVNVFSKFERMLNGLPESPFFYCFNISVDQVKPSNLFIDVTSDLYHSSDYGDTWSKVESYQKTPGITVGKIFAQYPLIIVISTTYSRLTISNDYGKTWHDASDSLCIILKNGKKDWCFHNSFCIKYVNDKIYIGTHYGLFISEDGGYHFEPLWNYNSDNLLSIKDLLIFEDTVMICSSSGSKSGIYIWTKNDSGWIHWDNGLRFKDNLEWQLSQFGNKLYVFAYGNSGKILYSSTNNGKNWDLISHINTSEFPIIDTSFSFIFPCGNYLFTSSGKFGVRYSKDSAKSWSKVYNDGLTWFNDDGGYSVGIRSINDKYIYCSACDYDYGCYLYRLPISNCEIVDATDVPEKGRDSIFDNDVISLQVFPNPASDKIYISVAQTPPSVHPLIEIYNVLGEVVKEIPLSPPFSKGEMELDVSSLTAGVYYILLKDGSQAVTKQSAVIR